jgi:hypothetical protein
MLKVKQVMLNRNTWIAIVALGCLSFSALGCSGEEKKPEAEPTKETPAAQDTTAPAPEDTSAPTTEDAATPKPEDVTSPPTQESDASPSDPDAAPAAAGEDASPSDPDASPAAAGEDTPTTPPEPKPAAAQTAAPFEIGKIKGFELSSDWFFAETPDNPDPAITRIQEAIIAKRKDLTACGLLSEAPSGPDAPPSATAEWVITDKGKIKKPEVTTPEGMDKKQAKHITKCLAKAIKDLDVKPLKGADDLAVRYHLPLSAAPSE